MRLHRFFVNQELQAGRETLIVEPDVVHQWKRVFRLRKDDQVVLFDGSGQEFVCRIVALGDDEARVYPAEARPVAYSVSRDVTLFAALIKKDNFEWILQKCTEVGVSRFVPVLSDRSEKKDLNIERAQAIIKEAAEQSGRGSLPELCPVISLDDSLSQYTLPRLAFHLSGEPFADVRAKFDLPEIGLLIGPEGGWSEREAELFKKHNITVASLGTQVLRAETAAVAASVLFLLK